MHLNILGLSLVTTLAFTSVAALAEPVVQAGETLESLSKTKISTTVNGQPGSINELVANGQIKLLNEQSNASVPAQPSEPNVVEAPQNQPTSVEPVATPATEAPAQAPQ